MKLSKIQQKLYSDFYESTCKGEVLDLKTEALVGLSAAMAMNCKPCTAYYIQSCRANNVSSEEVDAVLAKVMAVAAGQKRLQAVEAFEQVDAECGCAN